jgi:hypothetical protein
VTYGSLKVDDGNELTPTQVKDPPTLKWAADDDSYYLLCMTGTQTAPVLYPLSVTEVVVHSVILRRICGAAESGCWLCVHLSTWSKSAPAGWVFVKFYFGGITKICGEN